MRALHATLVFGVGLAAGSILVGPLGAQTQKQLRQARKLLDKIVLVDGAGSGLDADTVQGLRPEEFLGAADQAVDAAHLDGVNPSEIRATGIHVETLQASGVTLSSEECSNIMSCTVANPSNFSRNVLVQGMVNVRLGHTQGSDDTVEVTLATGATTCVSPGAGGTSSAWFHVDQGTGTSCCFRGTLNPVKTFPIAANSAATFYLNGTLAADSGAATRQVDSGNLHCTLVR
jgi:hypothetical protein